MWKVKLVPEAVEDLKDIDHSVRIKIIKGIKKFETSPLDYGEPLGNQEDRTLAGLRKIEPADGYRVVYWVFEKEIIVLVVAIGKRQRMNVYRSAASRIADYRKMTGNELEKISEIIDAKDSSK